MFTQSNMGVVTKAGVWLQPAPRGRVVGLTSWSDLVLARGLLEEKGLRLRAQARCGRLFYWEMSCSTHRPE